MSLYVALWRLIEPRFTTINSASYLFNFQPSDQTIFLRHTSRLEHETSLLDHHTRQSDHKPDQTTTYEYTTDHRPDPTTKLDHQITPPQPIQTTSSDHPTRPQDTILDYSASNQHSIPTLLKWYRSGAFFVGLGRGGYIELWMNFAKHTFHTRSTWSFRTLFRLKLIVVRLACGVPWAGKGLPFPFS